MGIQKSRSNNKTILRILLSSIMILSLILPASPIRAEESAGPHVNLSILATTDIHAHMMDYDYYSDKETAEFGLARTAELIAKHRKENPNTLLVDNGDLIQGNPLGEYAVKYEKDDIISGAKTHPIIDVMNHLDYDAGTLGNHEFNYGLDFLDGTIKGAGFPIVNANVKTLSGKHRFTPYVIDEKTVTDENGNEQRIKVGYIGFVPPQIMTWDKKHLEGNVQVQDIVESANETIPQMKAEGADVIIALAHTGIEKQAQSTGAENAVFDLATKTDGIDAIVSGHQHGLFPDAEYAGIDKFDVEKGTINGIPVVMPSNWGKYLGVIDLNLEQSDGSWRVADSKGSIEPIAGTVTSRDETVTNTIKQTHENTLEYVRKPVGQTEADINSFFAQVKDDPSIQIVTDAQKWYAQDVMKDSKYKDLPILSAGAPFKAGGRNGSNYYTNIAAGDLAIKNVGDLYLYDNTVQIVKLTGSEVKDWLEMSAGQFNQITPNKGGNQALLNDSFRSYNFDVIDGVTYQVDVTKPAKYNANGKMINSDSGRIINLSYEGKPIDADQEFLVVTNNYRASGGGGFPHLSNDKIVYASADENRQVLMNYILDQKKINPKADNNWSIAPVAGTNLTFESSLLAKPFAEEADDVAYLGESSNAGYGLYKLQFDDDPVTNPPDDDIWNLTVMHTNDTHAHLDDAARRMTKVNEVRNETDHNLLLDAGDVFSGDLYFTKWNGLADLQFMNKMGYDAMTFGNHEFDKGPKVLADFLSGNSTAVDPANHYQFKAPEFPIVSANVDVSKEPKLKPFMKDPQTFTAGEKKEAGIHPYILLDVDGEKVAVFGLTTEDTSTTSSPGKSIVFNDAFETAQNTVKEIQDKEKVNKIIALTHIGHNRDLELAKKVKGIDLIVGGHSHTLVDKMEVVDNEEPTIVAQAKEYGQYLGRVDLAFDKDGIVQTDKSNLKALPIDETIEEDPDAKKQLGKFKNELEDVKNEKVGYTNVPLDGQREHVRTKETNLGNFIADGMLAKAKESAGAQIAITNGGGIRAGIDKGKITLGEVLNVMPFGNTLYVADLTGKQIKEALEQGLSGVEDGGGAFPHVAGIEYTFTLQNEPGKRVIDVKMVNGDGSTENLNEERTYRVATNNFVGAGGDGYSVFTKASRGEDLGYVDYEIFTEQLEKEEKVSPKIENRVKEVYLPTKQKDGSWTLDNDELFSVYANNANTAMVYFEQDEGTANKINLKLTKNQIDLLKARETDPTVTIFNHWFGMKLPLSNLESAEAAIGIDSTEDMDAALANVYDFSIEQNGKDVNTFKEPVQLSLRINDMKKAKNPAVYYVDRKKKLFTKTDNGSVRHDVVTGYTNHFSEYTVLNAGADGTPPDFPADNPSDGNHGNDGGGNDGKQPNDGSDTQTPPGTEPTDTTGGSGDDTPGGGLLPDTATSMYSILLAGFLLSALGTALYLYQRRKQNKADQA
ncbi:multifunctional 2',3'-cyclic-nucleotide 2'-phosphodiesterase/3'-nucleotidase/5'-nucleotidase [Bacillus atrophaeus]|uniref:multifunctional 2',3'-cyclic-nucleotide 2'-phosphodiesterase/3'-nucleotidase/5'-nucleotidase n=1 Tax=Bacillus atrophaeus TaxID=1452 RepID=UPI002E23C6DF|nr:multifunctional 2',3'-cyclic-nucleotide 2'-phosphodiesterase/3'-nucleotidase/5'-nucleotidase [Bacillus atrophaeus]MED4817068.1 multifunctional 2',3'-cyclic-nucleotide 2'-phosphodiesterase/3'-nucleotidase/5'-nucleotidase [Bacillus atrophaeus]MED4826032.1 multifunctional 2',3'-cyclic-nucleotide 2'-phosphodiesterase/3'-nucleotidase/5'-nucleotidase [Bacillus atrophaeus]MED4846064.1 multifunctional 2',3'-cyclic-nucleotide 2'-phosphodiesterase/3'-nucleotidase/5'-nucleotidase [Bacillus atrophaeus]